MPLPLIPILLGGASLIASAVGIKKGFDAKENYDLAKRIGENAKYKYDKAVDDLSIHRENTNSKLVELGKLKVDIFQNQIKHLVEVIKQSKDSHSAIKDFESNISTDELKTMEQMVVKSLELTSATGSGAISGILAGLGAWGGVQALATASTGTAISSLAGAAATNATLAWLGGGALAAGGWGMAAGRLVLGGTILGPALTVAGFVMASKAEEAVTEAREYEAKINTAIEEINLCKEVLTGLRTNANEMQTNLIKLAETFDKHKVYDLSNMDSFNRMLKIGKSIKALLDMPIMEKDGSAVKGLAVKIKGYMEI